ncbi:Nramp family divalent metal transporter [Rhodococcus sp. NPDC059968]|uniref:Nramp family divalent metal transporter n=1 Tax=Rhodococcus sp. NPDC059968 TaxID=3347017 RepID=UPI00366E55BF
MVKAMADRATTYPGSAGAMDGGTLPAMPTRELPAAPRLRKIIGPGVVIAAVGIGTGEYLLHPFITSRVGLTFLWAAAIGLGLQYFINTEVARYTLATGETILTGFLRLWRGWAPLFIAMTVIPFAWPAWMTSSAQMLTFPLGGGNVQWIAIGGLVLIGAVLTFSPVVYKTVEKLEMFKIIMVLLFVAFAVVLIGWQPWTDLPHATVQGIGRLPQEVPVGVLMSALVFAGGGGAVNLAVSNWARDKGWGMGIHAPRVVSPVTGEEEAGTATGYQFEITDTSMSRWQQWWKSVRIEQFVTFYLVTLVSIVVFALLAYKIIGVGGYTGPADLGFIKFEGTVLGEQYGEWLKVLFWTIGAVSLVFANLVVVDLVARITSNILATTYLRDHTTWTEAKTYMAAVWVMVGLGAGILALGLDQPLVLIAIAALLNGLVMVVYCVLIIRVNGALDHRIGISRPRRIVLAVASVAYAAFTVYTIVTWIQS